MDQENIKFSYDDDSFWMKTEDDSFKFYINYKENIDRIGCNVDGFKLEFLNDVWLFFSYNDYHGISSSVKMIKTLSQDIEMKTVLDALETCEEDSCEGIYEMIRNEKTSELFDYFREKFEKWFCEMETQINSKLLNDQLKKYLIQTREILLKEYGLKTFSVILK